MTGWITLDDVRKRTILAQVGNALGINEQAVEKDIWVTQVLEALYSLDGISGHLVFKGGTSLSKGYALIERFSEDIDFAIDRVYLGFKGDLGKNQNSILMYC